MNSLPRFSKKRKAEIQAGLRTTTGALKMTAAEFVAKAAAKVGTSKQSAKQKAMKAADKWFSEWIRLRDAGPDGLVKCVTCSRRAHWRDMDCGHYVSRAKQTTRYDQWNAHAQCGGCNRFQGGKFIEHARAVDEMHGAGSASILASRCVMECRRSAQDFQYIADKYHALVLVIREREPLKYYRDGKC